MKKQTLKVQPPRKIYQPKYPSYEAPNPLLHPDSRPYPFSHRFTSWVTAGGLMSLMTIGAASLSAQSQSDSLYNAFPLENAGVPYMPVMFGTGMPERLQQEETLQAIRKAFADSGVDLKEKVWLEKEDVGVYLDGYSEEDKIGFVFLNYTNMDNSFMKKNSWTSNRNQSGKRIDLKKQIKQYEENRENEFQRFIKDKKEYQDNLTRHRKDIKIPQGFSNRLNPLAATEASREQFNTFYLVYNISQQMAYVDNQKDFIKNMAQYIDSRLDSSVEKLMLLQNVYSFRIQAAQESATDLINEEFNKLKKISSDKEFIKDFLTLKSFVSLNYGSYTWNNNKEFQEMKLEIMKSCPLKEWFDNSKDLEAFHDKYFISLQEAQEIDKKNKAGKQFIAPISSRDNLTIVPYGMGREFGYSEELLGEEKKLREKYNLENGMTPEIMKQKRLETSELSKKYSWDKLKNLTTPEKDSLRKKQKEEREAIKAKYEAMEKLTVEQEAAYQLQFDEIRKRKIEWSKKNQDEAKAQTLRKLEEEVKMYIQWAKSQMGG